MYRVIIFLAFFASSHQFTFSSQANIASMQEAKIPTIDIDIHKGNVTSFNLNFDKNFINCNGGMSENIKRFLNITGVFEFSSKKKYDIVLESTCQNDQNIELRNKQVVQIRDLVNGDRYKIVISNSESKDFKARLISDIIYEFVTGYKGYFLQNIIYIKKRNSYGGKVYTSKFYDTESRPLSVGIDSILLPTFHINKSLLSYTMFPRNNSATRVYVYNVFSDQKILISNGKKSAFYSSFNKEGDKVLLNMASEFGVNIFEYDMVDKNLRQISNLKATVTSPNYSHDEKNIVFVSDVVLGIPRIYTMEKATGKYELLLGSGTDVYGSPKYSPNGEYLLYIKLKDKKFHLYIMNTKNRVSKRLFSSNYIDNAQWSPGGSAILFNTSRNPYGSRDDSKIMVYDVVGNKCTVMPFAHTNSDPIWGPRIRQ